MLKLEVLQVETLGQQDAVVADELRADGDAMDALNLMLDVSDVLAGALIAL